MEKQEKEGSPVISLPCLVRNIFISVLGTIQSFLHGLAYVNMVQGDAERFLNEFTWNRKATSQV